MTTRDLAERGVRAFVALTLDAELRQALTALVAELKPRISGARWASPDTLHLTLRFLGEATPAQLAELAPRLRPCAAACPATQAPTAGLGFFPPRGGPRVLWVGLALPAAVYALQAACEDAAVAAGFAPEPRPFKPHLTLARFRERVRRPELAPLPPLPSARLERLVLFKSELNASGAVHTPLASFPLGT